VVVDKIIIFKYTTLFGAGLYEIRVLGSFGGSIMRNGGVCVVLGLSYAKQEFRHRLGVRL
jgi:hypothetical protein